MAATLAQSLAAGDSEAFAALYDRLAVRLLGAARTMTGSIAEAEDVVQDLFVELARGRARLAAVSDLEAYVFTMLRNAVHRRGRLAAVDPDLVPRTNGTVVPKSARRLTLGWRRGFFRIPQPRDDLAVMP